MTIKKIAIIGGGTAGWLTANHLGKVLKNKKDIEITLIESPDIPPIGVGEGTVPGIKDALKSFGISETEFIRSCDVTFKQSIKFVNWMDKAHYQPDNKNNFFHHLFNDTSPFGHDLTPAWLAQTDKSSQRAYADYVSPQHSACEQNKAPKTISTPEYEGKLGYAYHLNAAKFAILLNKNAQEKFSVKHLMANVTEVELNSEGNIEALHTDSKGRLPFDFYIDCTGFESLLMHKALKVPFVSKAKELLVNSALVVQVPTSENEEIPPYTIATAHQAGWIWDIALPNRRGVGFVYSNNHMSDEEAEQKLSHYLGDKHQGLSYRKLPMKIGHSEKFWHKNCVVLGLAQGFLEPLEASSILLTEYAGYYLAKRFPKTHDDMAILEKRFNKAMGDAWTHTIDFIKLHYCISDREDSQFWLDNKKQETIPTTLQDNLKLWQQYIPQSDDFTTKYDVFHATSYRFVLYGMNYKTHFDACLDTRLLAEQAKRASQYAEYLQTELPQHRELLNKIKQYGLQRI